MLDFFSKYDVLPKSVKIGIILLLISWCWFYVSAFYLFLAKDIDTRLLLVGPMICLAVVNLVNWARILCLTSNAMVILLFAVLAYLFFSSNNMINFLAALVTIAFFAVTSYFLAVKETSDFFKTYHKAAGSDDQEGGGR